MEDGFVEGPELRDASFAPHWRERLLHFVGTVHPRLREVAKEAFLRRGFGSRKTTSRGAPSGGRASCGSTFNEVLLPTTCVVVNKPPGLKHFPTTGLRPPVRKSFTPTAKSQHSHPAPRRLSLNGGIRQSHENGTPEGCTKTHAPGAHQTAQRHIDRNCIPAPVSYSVPMN